MKLIVEPEDGIAPIVEAIRAARESIDIGIFRLDRGDVAKALKEAVARGVAVRTLVAHTNRGGQKRLRKLEKKLLADGATVARTDHDLERYHNKLMIVDGATLFVLGFNYTRRDVDESRSFGVVTRKRAFVKEAAALFEADLNRRPYTPSLKNFIVSPMNARQRLAVFLSNARRQLQIYDMRLTDPLMIRILHDRARAGVDIRVLGRVAKSASGLPVEKFPGKRLHVRAIVRDGLRAFVGSQSLRKLELDGRREVGVIVRSPAVVQRIAAIFDQDWARTDSGKEARSA
jgi:phosphatidylserine/phosphatidylglycerophosphate/cardiolipin synthase-like enzyme